MNWRALAMAAVRVAATPAMAAELPRTGEAEVYFSVTPEQVAAVLKKGGFKTKIVKEEAEEGGRRREP